MEENRKQKKTKIIHFEQNLIENMLDRVKNKQDSLLNIRTNRLKSQYIMLKSN